MGGVFSDQNGFWDAICISNTLGMTGYGSLVIGSPLFAVTGTISSLRVKS